MPIYPTEEEISIYDIHYESPEYDKIYGMVHNRIHYSVMSWDFGRKILEPQISKFCPVSFTTEGEYKSFIKKLPIEKREHITSLAEIMESIEVLKRKNNSYDIERLGGQKKYDILLQTIAEGIEIGKSVIKDLFESETEYITKKILPYLNNKNRLKSREFHRKFFDVTPVKRWIVKRAHEFGYDVELHGDYDRFYIERRSDVERIGKKYQWIAYHEILSVLSDNYKIRGWSSDNDYNYVQGPWDFYARDVDPIYTRKNPEELPQDDMMILEKENEWWHDEEYSFWKQENEKWIRNIDDLPRVKYIICKKDEQDNEWVFLKKFVEWEKPKPIGVDKYSFYRKSVFYMIQGYIVRKKSKKKIIDFLKDKKFWGRWLPEASDELDQLLNREKYWSPAYNSSKREDSWKEISYKNESTGLLVLPITVDAKAQISEDKSGACINRSNMCHQHRSNVCQSYRSKLCQFVGFAPEQCVPLFELHRSNVCQKQRRS